MTNNVDLSASQQRLRLRRFYLSAAMYVLAAVPQAVSVYTDIFPGWLMVSWMATAFITNLGFYLLLRSNLNLRFKDPSLTLPQMLVAIAMVLFTQVYAGPGRGAYLVVLLIIMMFGTFKLNTRQLLGLSMLTIVAYAMTLPLIQRLEGDNFNFAAEMVLWCSFSAFLPFISVLSGTISELRKKLTASNAQLQQVLLQVTELATHDELTGLYNRRYVLEMLGHERNRVERGGSSFCVCLIDFDHFKRVNDTYGHQAGDNVLRCFAETVVPLLRNSDFLARYGGEEFLLFLPGASPDLAMHCAQRIREVLATTAFAELPMHYRLTVSIGVAQHELQEDVASLIDRADQAMYKAKQAGRDRVEMAPPTHSTDG